MKKAGNSEEADAMRSEYDFSCGVRNPYAGRFAKGSNLVMIRPEIFAAFPSEEAVNEALSSLICKGVAAPLTDR